MKLNITRARLTEQETEEVLEEDEEEEEEAEETIAPLLSNSVKWWECKRFNNPSSNELIIKKPLSPPKPKPKPKPKWGDFNMLSLVWLLAIAGLIVAAMVYHFFSRQHYKQFEDVLGTMCDERARMLQHQFAVSINHVHALALLVSTFYLGNNHPPVIDQVNNSSAFLSLKLARSIVRVSNQGYCLGFLFLSRVTAFY